MKIKPKQLSLLKQHGGTRKNAGRKKELPVDIQNHLPRELITGKHPLHVTFKLKDGLQCMRHTEVFRAFREAVRRARASGYHINQFSLLRNHGHMIVEVENKKQLEKLMKIIAIRLALRIKKIVRVAGTVFRDRYFLHVLKTPTEVKRALTYVLLNEEKHVFGNVKNVGRVSFNVFSSAHLFSKWKELLGRQIAFSRTVNQANTIEMSPPQTWLLQQGWLRA